MAGINGAIMRGYLRRGLIDIRFTETTEDIEIRLYHGEDEKIRVAFAVPWKIVENKNLWQPSKEQYKQAGEWLYHARASKAHSIRWRRQQGCPVNSFSDV